MQLIKVGCAILIFGFCVAYGIFIAIPSERYKQTVDAALAATTQRRTELKAKVKDPEANGFLTPSLQPFWSGDKAKGKPVYDAISAWANAYSYQGSRDSTDHVSLQKAKDPAYVAARRAFRALLPDLVRALGKPVFRPVNEDLDATTGMDEEAMTLLAMGLNGYAESLLAQDKPEEAALVYEMVFREGYLMSDDVRILQAMSGVSVQALAFQSLVRHLSPNAKLGPNQWGGLSLALAALTPTPTTLTRTVENDLAYGTAFLNRPRSSFDGDAKPLRGAYLVPGFWGRDLRVYHNIMGPILDQAKAGLITLPRPPDSRAAVLRGESGPGPALLVPDYDKQSARMALHSAKMCGLAAATAVFAYRARYGKFPSTLADLDKLKLQAPGGAPWSASKGVVYFTNGTIAEVGVAISPELFAKAGVDVEKAGKLEARNSLYFSLRPSGFLFRF